jgi:SNF2 family DNA or RNA helicase
MDLKEITLKQKETLAETLKKNQILDGEAIFNNGLCQVLAQSGTQVEFVVSKSEDEDGTECKFIVENEKIIPVLDNDFEGWDALTYACLLALESELDFLVPKLHEEHTKFTREGMIKRVLSERQQKAKQAKYSIKWADNVFGDHLLTNEQGVTYKIFLRDFDNETGYSDSPDAKTNKLGTTKHIMYVFDQIKNNESRYKRLKKTCPFIEIFLDPLNDNQITYFFEGILYTNEAAILFKYFDDSKRIISGDSHIWLNLINDCQNLPRVVIRPEVEEKIERASEKRMLENIQSKHVINYKPLKVTPFDYQKEGVVFAVFKKVSIIADEMGLGKTLQAISTAVIKKSIFGFKKTLVVCPASLKAQWKKEIEKFSHEKALIIEGPPEEREKQYMDEDHHFLIANYESIRRDHQFINKKGIDFLVLDEAQRAKNFETQTASSLKRINSKHTLVITGTPVENKLIDLYSIINILDPYFLGPLWEFSYQYCLFDPQKTNKITGYYNLKSLKTKLSAILIRREKREVLKQLPKLQQIDIPVLLSPLQAEYHASYASGIGKIVRKKFLTPYDMVKLQQLLTSMRMVCNSTHLIDSETNESPKLIELKEILVNKLHLTLRNDKKVIIFSEWVTMHKLIGQMLRELNIGFVELNGKIPVKIRGKLIKKFECDNNCKIFLSTEAGGAGLNLQAADTLINFELPWNPAKKNQRIGRVDRLGQLKDNLTVFNLITKGSIEERIASGLIVKQNLFEGALVESNKTDFVDFSNKGRPQFIMELEAFITENNDKPSEKASQENQSSVLEPIENSKEEVIDLAKEEEDFVKEKPVINCGSEDSGQVSPPNPSASEIKEVMSSGMAFLSGLMKMATGKDMPVKDQNIDINSDTGEVVFKFKLPETSNEKTS